MAKKFNKGSAPYLFDADTSWCTGDTSGELQSKGFGSCVGLVLWCSSTKVGMVAHFSGSLGEPTYHQKARDDAKEILLAMVATPKAEWDAWVFGGTSLATASTSKSTLDALDLKTSTKGQTETLIDLVRDELGKDANFDIAEHVAGYEGHSAVKLDLASGAVTFS
ncbi:hypothetical protein [Roseomonas fluvialis]|uniref:Chemoreceptor glutamine deamidase CheD n=1 Tax=Roseomonas fluvialis TaxID=1750527 RepID=A0ABM7Y9U7_9PROT|nr:hypothetical protein [Roseomonas fluvialis]BDG74754.1 hypothetical protein Rmf_46830 [Roseomonas fluvialis]